MPSQPPVHRVALLFNGSKIYDRGILAGIGNYLSGTRARWDLFLEEDFLCRLKGIERWQGDGSPRWKAYDRPVEEWKAELFNDTPASLTGTLGALAATGSLVLWPDRQEPRLMSLVPPLHIALLRASTVVDNFYELQQQHRWQDGMPTNALLISGPSKTADIEQVLAYGAHGPKDLVVLIVEDE